MAQDYNEYLAINVLNEEQLITYRTLSRALKVHSNLAKQMLYEFHRKQNAKKPGAVHATYLISGIRRIALTPHTNGTASQDDDDTVMQSSPPFPSSSAAEADKGTEQHTLIRSILLVKEEHLEEARSTFESITGVHIYSLEANGLGDVQLLTESNRKIATTHASEDPLEAWKQYGTIHNPHAQRRTRRNAPPPAAPPVIKDAEAKTKPFATTAKAKEAAMKAETPQAPSKTTAETEKKGPAPKPVQAKRQNSDIFKSFANAKPKAAAASTNNPASANASPSLKPEDEPMTGFSDDDGDDDDDMMPDATINEPETTSVVPSGKSKKEREAELQAMMERDDEPMEDAAATTTTPASGPEVDELNGGAIDKPASAPEPAPKETVTVENGRRRGKRRIMKKKTVKDEEGYLVTKEEAVWESFSEEEPEPKKLKGLTPAAGAKGGAAATAKKGAKPGQGNIMSFFAKK